MKSICVFCGSSMGIKPAYREAAQILGKTLADRRLKLICGGANVGLMGVVADATLAAGGEAIGVIPKFLVNKEIAHKGLTQLYLVDSMHERKTKMSDLADGFVIHNGCDRDFTFRTRSNKKTAFFLKQFGNDITTHIAYCLRLLKCDNIWVCRSFLSL